MSASAQIKVLTIMHDGGVRTINALRLLLVMLEMGRVRTEQLQFLFNTVGRPYDLIKRMRGLGFVEVVERVPNDSGSGQMVDVFSLTDSGRKVAEVFAGRKEAKG